MKNEYYKTMDYDSPSGKIRIDKLVPPFMSVEGGYGFIGVTAIDVGTGKIQCHTCGEWHEQLGLHIFRKHGILSNAYREKYGLFKSATLQSTRLTDIRRVTMLKMRAKDKKHRYVFPKGNWQAANIRGKKHPAARANRAGTCELQIADRIKLLSEKLGRTPGIKDITKEYGGGFAGAIHVRYGSYIGLLRKLGYKPLMSSHNPKYCKEYFLKRGVDAVTKENKDLHARDILNQSEQRHVYKFFKSWPAWEDAVLKEIILQADRV